VSPPAIGLEFAQSVGPSPKVAMTCGEPGVPQNLDKPVVLANGTSVTVGILSPLPKGTCTLLWTVTDLNLAPAGSGTFTFSVEADTVATTAAPTTTVAGAPGTTTVSPPTTVVSTPITGGSGASSDSSTAHGSGPLGLFRFFSVLGMSMLFGAIVVIAFAWNEGVEYLITVRYLRTAWGIAMGGTFLFVGALTAEQTGNGLGGSMVPTAWADVLDSTPGKAAVLRFLLVAGSVYTVMRPDRITDPATRMFATVPPALALVTLAFSRDEFGLIEWAAGAVHALAMAVWLGGLIMVTRVVLAGPGDADLVQAVRGFAKISAPALWATVVSGAVLLFELDRGHLGSSHGLVLIVKTLLVSVMVFVGVAARQFINQRAARNEVMSAPLATRLRRALGIEALVGVVVLALTAWLLALTPAGLAASGNSNLTLKAPHTFSNSTLGANVQVAFSERVGANDVRIEVITPLTALSGLAVNFVPPVGTLATGMAIEPIPLTGTGVAVLPKSAGFTLGVPGTWTVSVLIGGAEVQRQQIFVSDGSSAPATSSTLVGG
jgi:copper transport protein